MMKKMTCFLVLSMIVYCIYSQENSEKSLSDIEKITGLSKCWSEVKYNFVYFDKLSFDWDSLYQATIPVVLATKNDFEYFRELQRFIATLKDGHTSVSWERRDLWNNWATIPLLTKLIEGKMVVTAVLNDTLEQKGIKEGLEIIQINEMDVHKYVSTKIKPYIHSSTEQWMNLRAYGREATRGKKSEEIRLTFKDKDGKTFSHSISHSMSEKNLSSKPLFDFKEMDDNIGLLKINSFWGDNYIEQFDSIYEKLVHLDALIIDIRNNGGGNSNYSRYVLSHLTSETFKMSDWSSPLFIPAHASWNYAKEWYSQKSADYNPVMNKTIFSKPIVLLINEGTFSAAEDFCVGFRNMKRGSIIGTPSGGSTGNPIVFTLPGEGRIQICTKKDTYPDGTKFVGVGILPDIEVKETVSSYLSIAQSDVDNTLATAKAIELLKSIVSRK
ncbi:S41 family peptidase [Proteiniphilum sp. X52]|uniref:S41 family peptidase n=1 Tax=Proteiniphilum sp. X52 TaxID=2382159 RepID=UPI00131429E2|nr:S41 family peptidase [Proteiniphilum sp. X52]